MLRKGLTSYLVSKIMAKISKKYKFGHILKIPCKKFAFDKLFMGSKFKILIRQVKARTRVNPSNILSKSQIKSQVFIVL